MKVIIDEQQIDELLNRGIENIFPNREFLKSKMMKGERLTFYLGIDPTGPTLGHQIILLMGDFTAMIGDPTDKTATRKKLTHKEVMKNLKEYKKQASKFISFSGTNKAQFKFNSKWLAKMKFSDVLDLASEMTVEQMLKRDMFYRRTEEGKPIYIHEFLYPLMQGYDSVAMNVDGEIGGNDQTFNMLAGRDLMKSLKNKEKFVLATKLLVDSTGAKMGKTENNMISLDQSASEMFGKVMSWTDSLIIPGFEIISEVPLAEIETMKNSLSSGQNPRDLKIKLAREIVRMYHGEKESQKAEEFFINTFQKKEIPEDIQEVSGEGRPLDVLVSSGIAESISSARRLFDAGAVSDLNTSQKLTQNDKFEKGHVYKIGKHKFIKIK
jgi:tyrosyl-tRNA synthetase